MRTRDCALETRENQWVSRLVSATSDHLRHKRHDFIPMVPQWHLARRLGRRRCLPLLGSPPSGLGNIRVPRRIKDVQGKLEEHSPLQEHRQLFVQLWRKGNQDARAIEPALVLVPVVTLFVASLGLGPLGQGQAGHKHEEGGEQEGPHDGGVQRLGGLASDVAIRSGRCG
jgi:hypothetical protein